MRVSDTFSVKSSEASWKYFYGIDADEEESQNLPLFSGWIIKRHLQWGRSLARLWTLTYEGRVVIINLHLVKSYRTWMLCSSVCVLNPDFPLFFLSSSSHYACVWNISCMCDSRNMWKLHSLRSEIRIKGISFCITHLFTVLPSVRWEDRYHSHS